MTHSRLQIYFHENENSPAKEKHTKSGKAGYSESSIKRHGKKEQGNIRWKIILSLDDNSIFVIFSAVACHILLIFDGWIVRCRLCVYRECEAVISS